MSPADGELASVLIAKRNIRKEYLIPGGQNIRHMYVRIVNKKYQKKISMDAVYQ